MTFETAPGTLIDAELADFLQAGQSISVSTCNRQLVPTLARAAGCRISDDRRQLTIFISATQAAPVLECIRETGVIAAAFSQPSTYRTVQLKGKDAQITPLEPDDWPLIEHHRDAFVLDVVSIGFTEDLIWALLAVPASDMVRLNFTPTEAYSQTPGPRAGERLGAAT